MSNRVVLVDDTDPNIQYSGPWFTAQNSELDIGTNGPPFQNTLHGVDVSASFSYSFSGSHVIVRGSSITTNASGTQDPTWECFVDNISIGSNISAGADFENNWVFCQSDLKDGPHVLSMNVTVLQQSFWFDQIQYLPSSNVSLDNSTVYVDSSDPTVKYSSGWTELNGIVNLTQTAGSTVTYEFFGVSLSWLGLVPSNFSVTPTSAIYSIDGQNPISFFVPGLIDSNAPPLYNKVFFITETLSRGQHKLIVTYQGNSGTAPLALDNFVVENATSSATSALATDSSAPGIAGGPTPAFSSVPSGSSSGSNLGSNKSLLIGIIVGVVGGVIVLVLLLLLYVGRRNNRRTQKLEENLHTNPEPFTLSPPNYTSEVPSLTPQFFTSKFSRRREPANAPGTSRPTPPPLIGVQIDPITSIQVPANRKTERMPLMQPSTSAQGGDLEFLQHLDSGVRMPHAQGNRVELPPVYTSG